MNDKNIEKEVIKMATKKAIPQDPVPDREISFRIPAALVKEFGKEPRIVIRPPWTIGIILDPKILRPDILKTLGEEFEIWAIPKTTKR